MLYGIDVSHHQGTVDWRAVARDGIGFAFVKATEGTGFVDSKFGQNWRGAKEHGMVRGAYHFLHPGNGAAQARHFLDVVGLPLPGDLLVVDVETTAQGGHPTKADAAEFVTEVRRRLGPVRIGLYTGRWYWNGVLGNPSLADLPVWLWESHYVRGSGPYRDLARAVDDDWFGQTLGGLRPTVIQFSSSGTVAGVGGRCDVNVTQLDRAELAALAGAATPVPTEEEPMLRLYTDGAEVYAGAPGVWYRVPTDEYAAVLAGAGGAGPATTVNARQRDVLRAAYLGMRQPAADVDEAALAAKLAPLLADVGVEEITTALRTVFADAGQEG